MSAAAQLARIPAQYEHLKRERWGIRPQFRLDGTPYPTNSHWPRYCIYPQDAIKRRPGPLAVLEVFYEKAEKLDKERWILHEVPLSTLARWVGEYLARGSGESKTASEPVSISTLCYWLEQLRRLHYFQEWDENAETPGARRTRGDGRHKTSYVINSHNRALDLIAADEAIATPKNRTFWVRDGRPLSTEEAVAWNLDVQVAERMAEAWANNARFYDPNAPMKPTKLTPPKASAADVERICHELVSVWKIAATMGQAAEILRHARDERPGISAEALAGAITQAIHTEAARQRQKNRNLQASFSVAYFSRNRIQGIANVWHSEQLRHAAEEDREARIAAQYAAEAATRTNPPPDDD